MPHFDRYLFETVVRYTEISMSYVVCFVSCFTVRWRRVGIDPISTIGGDSDGCLSGHYCTHLCEKTRRWKFLFRSCAIYMSRDEKIGVRSSSMSITQKRCLKFSLFSRLIHFQIAIQMTFSLFLRTRRHLTVPHSYCRMVKIRQRGTKRKRKSRSNVVLFIDSLSLSLRERAEQFRDEQLKKKGKQKLTVFKNALSLRES